MQITICNKNWGKEMCLFSLIFDNLKQPFLHGHEIHPKMYHNSS